VASTCLPPDTSNPHPKNPEQCSKTTLTQSGGGRWSSPLSLSSSSETVELTASHMLKVAAAVPSMLVGVSCCTTAPQSRAEGGGSRLLEASNTAMAGRGSVNITAVSSRAAMRAIAWDLLVLAVAAVAASAGASSPSRAGGCSISVAVLRRDAGALGCWCCSSGVLDDSGVECGITVTASGTGAAAGRGGSCGRRRRRCCWTIGRLPITRRVTRTLFSRIG